MKNTENAAIPMSAIGYITLRPWRCRGTLQDTAARSRAGSREQEQACPQPTLICTPLGIPSRAKPLTSLQTVVFPTHSAPHTATAIHSH